MSEQSREMFVQLLLRNIRQMYYSRAYCEPRLQRFMIRAKPPQPPSQSQAGSEPKASTAPQAPSRPATEESIAADGQVKFCASNVLSQLRCMVIHRLPVSLHLFALKSNFKIYQNFPIEARLPLISIDTSGCRRRNGQSWLWWLGDFYYSPGISDSWNWFRQAADRVSGWGGGYGGWRQGWRVEVHHAWGMKLWLFSFIRIVTSCTSLNLCRYVNKEGTLSSCRNGSLWSQQILYVREECHPRRLLVMLTSMDYHPRGVRYVLSFKVQFYQSIHLVYYMCCIWSQKLKISYLSLGEKFG